MFFIILLNYLLYFLFINQIWCVLLWIICLTYFNLLFNFLLFIHFRTYFNFFSLNSFHHRIFFGLNSELFPIGLVCLLFNLYFRNHLISHDGCGILPNEWIIGILKHRHIRQINNIILFRNNLFIDLSWFFLLMKDPIFISAFNILSYV